MGREKGEGEVWEGVIGCERENTVQCVLQPHISHLHNDTCSSVNSTGWTGCQGKGQRISMFSGGRMVSW